MRQEELWKRISMAKYTPMPHANLSVVRLSLSKSSVEGSLSRVDSLSYDGPRTDIGLGLTVWKAY